MLGQGFASSGFRLFPPEEQVDGVQGRTRYGSPMRTIARIEGGFRQSNRSRATFLECSHYS
jgi:hypothetical protein